MLANAVLTIAAALEHASGPDPAGQVPLARNEIAGLLATIAIRPAHGAEHRMRWSRWRQYRCCACRYQRQASRGTVRLFLIAAATASHSEYLKARLRGLECSPWSDELLIYLPDPAT